MNIIIRSFSERIWIAMDGIPWVYHITPWRVPLPSRGPNFTKGCGSALPDKRSDPRLQMNGKEIFPWCFSGFLHGLWRLTLTLTTRNQSSLQGPLSVPPESSSPHQTGSGRPRQCSVREDAVRFHGLGNLGSIFRQTHDWPDSKFLNPNRSQIRKSKSQKTVSKLPTSFCQAGMGKTKCKT